MGRQVEIAKGLNGATRVYINGQDVSPYIMSFSLSQDTYEAIPILTLKIPATSVQMPSDFFAALEIHQMPPDREV